MTDPSAEGSELSDRLADLLFYAPLGLLWERDQVLERLVKRGRSQTQLAKLAAQMAAQRGPEQVEEQVRKVLETAARSAAGPLSRVLIEAGIALGVPGADTAKPTGAPTDAATPAPSEPSSSATEDASPSTTIGGVVDYDSISARDLIGTLPSLDGDALAAIKAHEEAGRKRKTVLARIDQLLGAQ